MSTRIMSLRRLLCAALPAAALMAAMPTHAHAQATHIRGTLSAVTDHDVTVTTHAGKTVEVPTTDKTGIFLVTKADMSAVKAGKFVGITSVERNGKPVAEEVHVFADSLRGLAEGHYPWDRDSESNMMTNANIAKIQSVGGADVLKLDYKGGEQTITVPPDAAIVEFNPGKRDELKTGRQVFAIERDGKTVAIVVGADGVKPPM